MKPTAKVIECDDEDNSATEVSTAVPVIQEESSIQQCLKNLTKQITKYKRLLVKATSEEEQKNIQKSIEYINDLRFILKMSPTNKCVINRLFKYIEYPCDYQAIVDDAIKKIEQKEI